MGGFILVCHLDYRRMAKKKHRAADTSFFVYPDLITDEALVLEGDNFHHAINVLRQETGSELRVVDGHGMQLVVRIENIETKKALCSIISRTEGVGESNVSITLAVGMLKAKDRFEFLVEKAIELGVNSIVQLQTARTVGRPARPDRLHRIAVAAMKQSNRSFLPEISAPVDLHSFANSHRDGLKMFCSMDPESPRVSEVIGRDLRNDVVVVVGPEGGLDNTEEELLASAGYLPASLGNRRLRTETACLSVLALIQLQASS